jgi:hypothetical protein
MVDTSYPQAQLDEIYTRSVNSFFCPACSMGRCRVIVESQSLPYDQWQYECGKCGVRGTKSGIYASLNCRMCGRTLNEWGHCPTGCNDNAVTLAIISAYSKPAPQYKPVARCPECFCEIGHCEHTAPIESMNAEHIRNGEA